LNRIQGKKSKRPARRAGRGADATSSIKYSDKQGLDNFRHQRKTETELKGRKSPITLKNATEKRDFFPSMERTLRNVPTHKKGTKGGGGKQRTCDSREATAKRPTS